MIRLIITSLFVQNRQEQDLLVWVYRFSGATTCYSPSASYPGNFLVRCFSYDTL